MKYCTIQHLLYKLVGEWIAYFDRGKLDPMAFQRKINVHQVALLPRAIFRAVRIQVTSTTAISTRHVLDAEKDQQLAIEVEVILG